MSVPTLPDHYGPDSINFDEGFCNPNKLQNIEENRQKSIDDLVEHGYTEDEARAELNERSG